MNTETTTKRKPREVQLVNFSVLASAQEKLGLKDTAFGDELGYRGSSGVIQKWRAAGKAPFVAGLAAEGLVRRNGQDFKPHYGDRVWLLRLAPDQQQTLKTILQAMKIKWTEI